MSYIGDCSIYGSDVETYSELLSDELLERGLEEGETWKTHEEKGAFPTVVGAYPVAEVMPLL
jgi:hypothetical protein